MQYFRVLITFARNSLVRDMTYRTNFVIETISSMSWLAMNLAFYALIFRYSPSIGEGTGWEKYPFFAFLATALFVNSLMQTFFMTNMGEFSDLIRLGALDFVLLKPMDPQFLVSFPRIEWSSMGNFFLGFGLLGYSLFQLHYCPSATEVVLYVFFIACGVAIYYSLMVGLSATSVWLGRNLSLLDFWFYLTTFSRYPMEIYRGTWGTPLRQTFTFVVPVLVAINVPARFIIRSLRPETGDDWLYAAFAFFGAVASILVSRWVFKLALSSYRSASS